jgi:hypothetical protein
VDRTDRHRRRRHRLCTYRRVGPAPQRRPDRVGLDHDRGHHCCVHDDGSGHDHAGHERNTLKYGLDECGSYDRGLHERNLHERNPHWCGARHLDQPAHHRGGHYDFGEQHRRGPRNNRSPGNNRSFGDDGSSGPGPIGSGALASRRS